MIFTFVLSWLVSRPTGWASGLQISGVDGPKGSLFLIIYIFTNKAPTSKASQQINFLLAYPTSLVNQYFGFTIKLRTPTIDHLTSTIRPSYPITPKG
ncbi:hypothetical protein QVD99_003350 [Batrachochytrium dendrobatidis]|nr:hypothetical protein QVD99_003350 [Batrachochytrium dendrobatidis]